MHNEDQQIEPITSKEIACILRGLANIIENNPSKLKEIKKIIKSNVESNVIQNDAKQVSSGDVLSLYSTEGEFQLRQKLEPLDVESLQKIIMTEGFDPSRKARKWKTKDRLIDLIVSRVSSRKDKGSTFIKYSQ